MASQRWRDRLLKELHRQGLPSSYVSRLVEELTDHAADLFMEDPSMDAEQHADARLGTPEHLAVVAKAEFQRRTFAGRHPVLTFLAGPIVAVIGILMVAFFMMYIPAYVLEAMNGSHPTFVTGGCFCFSTIVQFVPFVLSTWVFVWLGRRSGLRRWSMVACGLIAALAFFFSAKIGLESDHELGWGWGFTFRLRGTIAFNQIIQAAVPLAFGIWMLWRSSESRLKMLAA